MAGYLLNSNESYCFHIDTPNVANLILKNAQGSGRVITLQLDGDELAAALWGLENYNKARFPKERN